MSIASVEEFQSDPVGFLAAVEKEGKLITIARDQRPVARLVPVESVESLEEERKIWLNLSDGALLRAYGPGEPEYTLDMIIEHNPDYRP